MPFVCNSFFAGEDFIDLADAQRRAVEWCRVRAGQRVHGTHACLPVQLFELEEKPRLLPAPSTRRFCGRCATMMTCRRTCPSGWRTVWLSVFVCEHAAAGETLSDRLRRYAEEGVRRDEHPLITFRDGPTGRRAGLVGGPDVWEVVMWVEDLAGERDPVALLVDELTLSRPQIEAALRYRGAYPDEVDARIDLHRQDTAAASNA